jgi:sporulation protein YlmC with PRC-barrel domain
MTPLLVGVAAGFLTAQDAPTKIVSAPVPLESHLPGAARCKASQLVGLQITNSKNESLGEIQDIVLDNGNRHIAYAVVAFGGTLGMGEKYFAMPWRLIEISQRSTNDMPRATLGLDQATLKAAPGFDKSKWPDMATATWAKQVDAYYSARNEKLPTGGAAEPKGSGLDGKSGVARLPTSKAFVYRRLSKLIGMDVVNTQYKKLAYVEDLVVESKFATVDGVLLSFGGTLGFGEQIALVPSEALALDQQNHRFVFPCTEAMLVSMALPEGKLPALNNDAWLVSGRACCAKASEDRGATDGDLIVGDASGAKPVPFADSYDLTKIETIKGAFTTIGSVRIGDQKEERVRLRVRLR